MTHEFGRVLQSQNGDTFVEIISDGDQLWISIPDAIRSWPKVLGQLSSIGIHLLRNQTVDRFKTKLEEARPSGKCLAAECPGWLDAATYVYPDGTVDKPPDEDRQIIIRFQPDLTFRKCGSHRRWLKGIRPFYNAEPTLRFSMQFALTALLIAKFPSQRENPVMELVGAHNVGKTTIARCASSIFGGSTEGLLGIGRSANMTANAFRQIFRNCNDSLLFLDETNVADENSVNNLKIIFDAASGEERARFDDFDRKPPTRGAVMMTGNMPLEDHSKTPDPIREAARTRLITLEMREPIFSTLPDGYADRREAITALSSLIESHYGTAVRKMIRAIIKDEAAFLVNMERYMNRFLDKTSSESLSVSDRQWRLFALCYATGKMAKNAKVLPESNVRNDVCWAMDALSRRLSVSERLPARESLIKALRDNASSIATVVPGDTNEEASSAIAWRYRKGEDFRILFSALTADDWFGQQRKQVIRDLHNQGIIKGEQGERPRPDIKAPTCVPYNGRLFSALLPKSDVHFLSRTKTVMPKQTRPKKGRRT